MKKKRKPNLTETSSYCFNKKKRTKLIENKNKIYWKKNNNEFGLLFFHSFNYCIAYKKYADSRVCWIVRSPHRTTYESGLIYHIVDFKTHLLSKVPRYLKTAFAQAISLIDSSIWKDRLLVYSEFIILLFQRGVLRGMDLFPSAPMLRRVYQFSSFFQLREIQINYQTIFINILTTIRLVLNFWNNTNSILFISCG